MARPNMRFVKQEIMKQNHHQHFLLLTKTCLGGSNWRSPLTTLRFLHKFVKCRQYERWQTLMKQNSNTWFDLLCCCSEDSLPARLYFLWEPEHCLEAANKLLRPTSPPHCLQAPALCLSHFGVAYRREESGRLLAPYRRRMVVLLMVSVIPGHYKSEIRSEISINSWKISRSILINSLSLLILFLLIFFYF